MTPSLSQASLSIRAPLSRAHAAVCLVSRNHRERDGRHRCIFNSCFLVAASEAPAGNEKLIKVGFCATLAL